MAHEKKAVETATPSPPADKPPESSDILLALLTEIAAHLGNPPRLEALLAELQAKS